MRKIVKIAQVLETNGVFWLKIVPSNQEETDGLRKYSSVFTLVEIGGERGKNLFQMYEMQKKLFATAKMVHANTNQEDESFNAWRDRITLDSKAYKKTVISSGKQKFQVHEPLSWSYLQYSTLKEYKVNLFEKLMFGMAKVIYPNSVNPIDDLEKLLIKKEL